MFPLRWNFPFRKKDGSMSTIQDEIDNGGGGGYTLPTASDNTKGGVKIGSGLSMDEEVLNNTNPTPYSLPTASDDVLGGIKVGSGLSIVDGVLSVAGGSGGSIHAYSLYTNVSELDSLLVITKSDTEITNLATFKSAITVGSGFVIILRGQAGTAKVPNFMYRQSNGGYSTDIMALAIDNGAIKTSYEYTTYPDSFIGSVSTITKLF